MSYICIMGNGAGAVAAGDSRETFPARIHLDWRQKCFCHREQGLIWACCGPTLRLGVDILGATGRILRGKGSMEERIGRIHKLVAALTRVPLPGGDPGAYRLLMAQWTGQGFALWDCQLWQGKLEVDHRLVPLGVPFALQAGAWHRELPPIQRDTLSPLSYEQLRTAACQRVTLAIRRDEARLAQNSRHNQTIGGRVRLVGLRVTSPLPPADPTGQAEKDLG